MKACTRAPCEDTKKSIRKATEVLFGLWNYGYSYFVYALHLTKFPQQTCMVGGNTSLNKIIKDVGRKGVLEERVHSRGIGDSSHE